MAYQTVQANAGDSRSVLGVKGRAKPLSFDHKPQNDGKVWGLLAVASHVFSRPRWTMF